MKWLKCKIWPKNFFDAGIFNIMKWLNARFWASLFDTGISDTNEMIELQDFDIKALWYRNI